MPRLTSGAMQFCSFSLAPRVEDHDVQMMDLYWKESASLFQSAGMSSLVSWMFQITELFLSCLSVQCKCSILFWSITANGCHKKKKKNCSTSSYFQHLSAHFILFWFWPQPIKRHETDIQKWLRPGLFNSASTYTPLLISSRASRASIAWAMHGFRGMETRPTEGKFVCAYVKMFWRSATEDFSFLR